MGQIAAEAQMSVGQIYRYFANKEAIVHAIVERITAQRLAWMLRRDKRVDYAALLANRRDLQFEEGDRILLMEVTAEATRNPAVAEIVREANRRLSSQAVALVRAEYPELSEEETAARVEFFAVLSEGTAFRVITEQGADPAHMEPLYRDTLRKLFPRMTDKGLLS